MVFERANYERLAKVRLYIPKRPTFVFFTSFQIMIGMMKMGMPMYDAMKSAVLQLPLRNTGNPATRVMIVAPMNPYQAVKGWKGLFQGNVSRLTF